MRHTASAELDDHRSPDKVCRMLHDVAWPSIYHGNSLEKDQDRNSTFSLVMASPPRVDRVGMAIASSAL